MVVEPQCNRFTTERHFLSENEDEFEAQLILRDYCLCQVIYHLEAELWHEYDNRQRAWTDRWVSIMQ